MMAVTLIIALALAPLILLTACFAAEVVVGLWPLPPGKGVAGGPKQAVVIIVPAHNEEAILGPKLAGLQSAALGRARILVVADNCTDSTAEIARQSGTDVIERFDPERRGKGFALDYARRHLEAEPPQIVIIIDADCATDGPSIDHLIDRCALTGSPCQATYVQASSRMDSPAVQLSTFAFFIKNVIRQRALQRLAGRALLLGSGMAIPWPIFARSNLATGNIVEDLKLGQELAEAGHSPLFVEEATVSGNAETETNTLSQRSRWEGGFLQNALTAAPALLGRSLARSDLGGIWGAINLMIPPFALLLLLDLIALALAAAISWLAGAHAWPLIVLATALLLAAVAVVLAWLAGGSRFVTLSGLARVPLYVLWKLPMYVGFARAGAPKDWVRTSRGE
jgi:cellulose synthase/poly-beta-1,6-N-acetylglucosamine synthase-like glycosyltransferase